MADFFDRLKRGFSAANDSYVKPGQFSAGEVQIVCPHCKHNEFEEGSAQLNTRGLTFLNLDWLNRSAVLLVCAKCGFIQWFGKKPQRL